MRTLLNKMQILYLGVFIICFGLIFTFSSMFVVNQRQQAMVIQFGRVRSVINQTGVNQPGLYFKIPFLEHVIYFDKRVLGLDLPQQVVLTSDRQNLDVDAFARYRIQNPLKFYQSVRTLSRANVILGSFMNSSLRKVLASSTRDAIVRTNRIHLMEKIQYEVNQQARDLGVQIVDVRMTRVDLPPQNSTAVFKRMISERKREAANIRANGKEKAAIIRAEADRESVEIIAHARQSAEILKGEGEAERNLILSKAYSADPKFFVYSQSLTTYRKAFDPSKTKWVLSTNSELFKYFNRPLQP